MLLRSLGGLLLLVTDAILSLLLTSVAGLSLVKVDPETVRLEKRGSLSRSSDPPNSHPVS